MINIDHRTLMSIVAFCNDFEPGNMTAIGILLKRSENGSMYTEEARTCVTEVVHNYSLNHRNQLSSNITRPYMPPVWAIITWSSVFSIMALIAIVSNITVMAIILGHAQMRTVTNMYLLNLAITDVITTIFNTMFNFAFLVTSDWKFGQNYCKFTNFVANMTVAASVFTITVSSFDR